MVVVHQLQRDCVASSAQAGYADRLHVRHELAVGSIDQDVDVPLVGSVLLPVRLDHGEVEDRERHVDIRSHRRSRLRGQDGDAGRASRRPVGHSDR